jgi:hypothetical protein
MGTFDAPIPGQSLTAEPRNAPYERPPEITDPIEALDAHLSNLNKDGAMEDVIHFLEMGVDIQTMVQGILRSGVVAGIHTIDVSLIIAPVLHEHIKGFAEAVGVDFDEGFENKKKKEAIKYRRDVDRARRMLRELEEDDDDDFEEPEMEDKMESQVKPEMQPEMEDEEMPAKTGLMARV